MKMFRRIRQYGYVMKVRIAMTNTTGARYLALNEFKSQALRDLVNNRITKEFYMSIFGGGDAQHHYSKVNMENIKNYKF